MALDPIRGETIEGYDPVFRVVPASKYADQPKLTTIVKRISSGKFKREIDVEMPLWKAAIQDAMMAFVNAGAPPGELAYDAIAQEYPRSGMVVFVFEATIKGENVYHYTPFMLSKAQIADLTTRNLWQPYTVN